VLRRYPSALACSLILHPSGKPTWLSLLEETPSQGNMQNDEGSGAKSAKMGKDEGTQTSGANQSTPPETKTQKLEQPPEQKPTTGE
jgi:hypothetical protein